ncbi:MAG TPA: ribosome assembly cofactor RimP [Bacteroidetes bacterium]|nr:ribosome assembly cofactor RimP [Bacteroidota bacterium]
MEEKINHLLVTKFQEEGFRDCFLVGIELHKNNKLEVFVDSDHGISLGQCQRISRHLENHLDEQQWLGEKYTLEVSSPGLTKPLKLKRQYIRNIGRNLELTLRDGTVKTATLKEVTDKGIVVQQTVVIKEGKKKKKTAVETQLAFENIKKALVVISFKESTAKSGISNYDGKLTNS